jgi:hypothetical protein
MGDIDDKKRGIGADTMNRDPNRLPGPHPSKVDRGTAKPATGLSARGTASRGQTERGIRNPNRIERTTPASNPGAAAALKAKQQEAQALDVQSGLVAGSRYEFKNGKRSSWIEVGADDVRFIDESGRGFLTLRRETMRDVLKGTGDALPAASDTYKSSVDFREAQVNQYYAKLGAREGNETARNTIGSGQFRYELSRQHLTDSVWNELDHVATVSRFRIAESALSQLADKNKGMECYGTTLLNVLKAKGLVPPKVAREDFEYDYRWVLGDLPKKYRDHVLVGGGGGAEETKAILEGVVSKLSQSEWSRFTGMADKRLTVETLSNASQVATKVKQGDAVLVGSPGHYRSAVGGTADKLKYDDPLGLVGHLLYDDKPVGFGVLVEETRERASPQKR